MSVTVGAPVAPTERGVILAEVAHVLGVPMPTLRSWEIRYGIPDVPRAFREHRRYTPAALHALRLMRDEIARGQRAGLAAQSVHDMLNAQGANAQVVAQILMQAQLLDRPALDRAFDTTAAMQGVGHTVDEVLLPAMRQVGSWAGPTCGSGPENLLTDAVRGWVARRSVYAPPPRPSGPVLLACGPGDEHTVGIEALGLLLRLAGWPARILGPRTGTAHLLATATAKKAVAIVIVSQLASARRQAIMSIRSVHRADVALFYAGNAFAQACSRRTVPGVYLGTDLRAACALIDDALTRHVAAP